MHQSFPTLCVRPALSSGLVLTVFRDETIRGSAAALVVQAAWRCYHLRGNLPLGQLMKMNRAARRIQRAWRACKDNSEDREEFCTF